MSSITTSAVDSGSDRVITINLDGAPMGTITLEGITSASANFANLEIGIPDGTYASCEYEFTPPARPSNVAIQVSELTHSIAWDDPGDTAVTSYEIFSYDAYGRRDETWRTIPLASLNRETQGRLKRQHDPAETRRDIVQRCCPGDTESHHPRPLCLQRRFTTFAKPPAPRNLSAAAGSATVTLTWDDPGDEDINRYQYRVWNGITLVADWTDVPGSGATTTSYTVTGLTNGTPYTIELRARRGDFIAPGDTPRAFVVATPSGPLTASFQNVPAQHDGSRLFSFELRFSDNFPGRMAHTKLRDQAFQVENGSVKAAARVVSGENQRWTISVRPDSSEDVVITLPATTDCSAAGAVCTEAGRGAVKHDHGDGGGSGLDR